MHKQYHALWFKFQEQYSTNPLKGVLKVHDVHYFNK